MESEWQEMPLSQAVMINPSVKLVQGQQYPFVDMKSVDANERYAYAGEQREYTSGGSRFASGDTLMARITPCLENGKIGRYFGVEGAPAHGSTEFIVIRGKKGVTLTDYAYYLAKSDTVVTYAISQMTGTSGRQRVPTSSFDYLNVPVPPLSEQHAIAHILGTLDDKIELNRRTNETLEAMARAIFKSWFVDFDPVRAKAAGRTPQGMDVATADLFPDAFEDSELGEVPKGWRVGTIRDVCEVAIGGDWGDDTYIPGTVAVTCLRGVDLEHIRDSGYAEAPNRWVSKSSAIKRRMSQKDILIAASGLGPLGRCIWISSHLVSAYSSVLSYSNFCKRLTATTEAMAVYIDNILIEMHKSGDIWEYATGTSIPNLDVNGLLDSKLIVIPPETVLSKYYQVVNPIYARLYSCESRTLAALRDALLPKLLSGEIKVENRDCRRFTA